MHNPERTSFLAINGYVQRLDLLLHESGNSSITMSAVGRKQPLTIAKLTSLELSASPRKHAVVADADGRGNADVHGAGNVSG